MDSPSSPAPAPVHRVSPDVWALALEHADGDRRRLEVVGTDLVMIHNRPR